jgi:hypothetical protein
MIVDDNMLEPLSSDICRYSIVWQDGNPNREFIRCRAFSCARLRNSISVLNLGKFQLSGVMLNAGVSFNLLYKTYLRNNSSSLPSSSHFLHLNKSWLLFKSSVLDGAVQVLLLCVKLLRLLGKCPTATIPAFHHLVSSLLISFLVVMMFTIWLSSWPIPLLIPRSSLMPGKAKK